MDSFPPLPHELATQVTLITWGRKGQRICRVGEKEYKATETQVKFIEELFEQRRMEKKLLKGELEWAWLFRFEGYKDPVQGYQWLECITMNRDVPSVGVFKGEKFDAAEFDLLSCSIILYNADGKKISIPFSNFFSSVKTPKNSQDDDE